ncbi:serine/threonine-protein kinase HipA [Streptosporangium becharense]|uniref:Serine/threonine-protein kinase HipA n=1 Tax=Streptosporangium becharense TaxID=1816182 RepID=A0A7W9IFZ7_9ACTN|nr:type II toxin-antitoxin system HipA family toxin [Streptosporangium becharense]MBB2909616.1 serine/threonine-protein kinase HipA [Streptosporangium becharense]MBB5819428.1 serine/threonine-protein kinase HipA [Streptosporangium becharense]
MPPTESRYAVVLGDERVGTLYQRGDFTRFVFLESYLLNPSRAILGLNFEQNLTGRHAAALRLPPWFSNLLPEGVLRDWIATDRGVSADREMELLAQVGHDLPGAVRVLPCEGEEDAFEDPGLSLTGTDKRTVQEDLHLEMRFSLAGVALKFSMLAEDHRLTLPAFGQGGDWIVKLPDRAYPDVPRNEYAMMSLAAAVGIDVPEVRLYRRDELDTLPSRVWPGDETLAYAVRRFDRGENRQPIHIEDLAQVRGVYPSEKYLGNYETVAALVYRLHDISALQEFARRLAFTVLISNGDAHLKNWSLVYRNPVSPTLSPAYDLVCTAAYMGEGETLGMKFAGSRRFDGVTVGTFRRLERRLCAEGAGLEDVVVELVSRVRSVLPMCDELLAEAPQVRQCVASSVARASRTLLSTTKIA